MKFQILIIICISSTSIFAQRNARDTVFLLREDSLYYHAVFIENNKHSDFYSQLLSSRNSFNVGIYEDAIQSLRDAGIKLTKRAPLTIFKQWTPLYVYKGKYYVYSPSDGLYNNWIDINDSTISGGGDIWVNAVVSATRKGKGKYQVATKDPNNKNEILNIYTIDQKNQTAVFEYPNRTDNKYELRVAT
ncbi:MAG TPA: hypothetical protein VL307_14745, partial [Chitinophagaceae bacterium]|nr:hypothetical protein [Chitinophagaceae bacterium]